MTTTLAVDFADFLVEAPGVNARVGTCALGGPDSGFGHHHEEFDIAEKGLAVATELHIRYALDYSN
ncbi:hypothetical protein [Alkalibacterium sp. 20]|uniref:hypothetical protein n=1 Tax=Alkalibacterium sp. 20 TaxID=1798803 RepID=UPI00090023AF|nr:hypothetical protein [Alkalibacterium sp. 20]OJF97093.1 hypothetical protein AX762_00725 [Alkalibacterium sp. 20]